jgi:hypothetical protein
LATFPEILGIEQASKLSGALGAIGKMPEIPGFADWQQSRGFLGLQAATELSKMFAGRSALADLAPLSARISELGWDHGVIGLQEQFRRSYESFIVVEYTRVWAAHPLWFLLDLLNPAELPALINRPQKQVFEAVLDGLEVVVRESQLTTALLGAVDQLPFLIDIQRQWLMFGLQHARRGEWVQAVANLFIGFEGALHSGALHAELIKPSGEGNLLAAEAIIKRSELSVEFQDFAIKLVFGGRGNAFRHGRPKNEARDQVLLLVVALVGWIDSVLGVEATRGLARALQAPLRQALDRSAPEQI